MGIFATEHLVDVTVTGGYPRTKEVSSVELDYRLVNDFQNSHVIVNPRFKQLGNKNINAGIGFGVRQDLDWGMFGAHLAADYSYILKTHNLQIVPTAEFLMRRWDFNINAYIPIKNLSCYKPIGQVVCTHRYFESEVVYKWKYAHFSLGHNFNIEKMKNGYMGKVSKEIGPVNLVLSGGRDGHHGDHVKLSAVYNIPTGSSKDEYRRINRHCGAVYDCKIRKASNKPVAKSNTSFIYVDVPTPIEVEKTVKAIEKTPPNTQPTTPSETHWYDFLFKPARTQK